MPPIPHYLSPMPDLKQNWPSWAALAAIFVALFTVVIQVNASDIGRNFAILVRMIMVIGAISGVIWARGEMFAADNLGAGGPVFLRLAGLSVVISWLTYMRALGLEAGANLGAADRLSIGTVVIALAILYGPRLDARGMVGVVLVVSGAFLLAR